MTNLTEWHTLCPVQWVRILGSTRRDEPYEPTLALINRQVIVSLDELPLLAAIKQNADRALVITRESEVKSTIAI